MQTTKRMLALLMCLVMLFTAVPVEAFATGEASSDGTVVTEPVPDTTEAPSDSAEVTEAPTEVTEAPVEPTEAPTEVSEATEEVTEPPVEETEAPSEPSDEELMIMAVAEGNVVMVEHNGETTYYATLQKAFDGFAPSNNTYGGTYVVTLLEDVPGMTAVKNFQYPTEVLNITLDLNGHTITGNGTNIAVNINLGSNASGVSSGTFTITDSAGGGVITGGKGGVYVYGKNATFNFQGGTITGNHGATKGGGILVGATTFFRMTGGVITGNSVTGTSSANTGLGGGVCANYATISGGAIYGNTANGGSGKYTGRGGGVCTEITRTSGYSTLTIADGVVFGNTAANAGDDIMAQGNGSAKFTLSIGTENWYVDGWKGTKMSVGETDRYSAENPVAYTDGGFADVKNVTVGLKYVAPSTEPEEPQVPAAPYDNGGSDTNVADFIQFVDANGHGALLMNITGGFTAGEVVWNEELGTWTCDLSFDAAALLAAYNESYAGHRYADEIGETITVTHKWFCGEGAELSTTKGQWVPNVDGNIYKVNVTCKAIYTVTYTDGVEDEEIFADQTYTVEEGEPTPAYSAPTEPTREGYTFAGWTPEVAETVTGNVTYTATWEKKVAYVARLESTGEKFETLQAALDAAKAALSGDLEADKITMIGDTTECVKLAWTRTLGNMALTIDLNGHTVTGNGTNSVMTFSGLTSGTGRFAIVIEDSSADKTGTITGGVATSGGAIKMDGAKGGDSLTINGGNFTGNTASSNGGALYCAVVGATITVNGGTFTGNTAASGGAISAYSLVINGGTFTGNTANGTKAYTGRGGAIVMWGTVALSLDINGGVIYGNTASRYGDDIVFCSTNKTTASMSLMNAADMGIEGINGWCVDGYYGSYTGEALLSARYNAEQPVEFTDYADFSGKEAMGIAVALKAAKAYDEYTVTYTDGVEGEEIFADQTHTVRGGESTPAFNGEPTREGYTFEGWLPEVAETVTESVTYTAQWKKIPVYVARLESTGEQFETLQAALDAAKAALSGDLEADKITMIGDTTECVKLAWTRTLGNMALTIDLNGHTVTGNGTNSVMTFSGLTSGTGRFAIVIEDSSEDKTGTITGGVATSGGAIKMDGAKSGDSLTINGGNFTGNTATSSGGALYCAVVGANVTINGGSFSGNTAKTGGAISAYSLVINGGSFTKNSAIGDAQFTGRGGAIQVWGTGAVKLEINGGTFSGNTAARYGDDVVFCSTNNTSASMKLVELTGMKWYVDGYYGAQSGEAKLSERFSEDNAVEFTDYDFSGSEAKGIAVALKLAERVLPPMPEAPTKYGENVTSELIRVICDSDPNHAPMTIKWQHQSTKVRDWVSGVVWSDEYNTWIVPVRIDSVSTYYVWAHFENAYNDILHDLVDENQQCIDTYLKWDAEKQLWVTLDEQPIDVHVTCKTIPDVPSAANLGRRSFQIQVMGDLDGDGIYGENGLENDGVWEMFTTSIPGQFYENLVVYGSREEGFFIDVTVTLEDGDIFITNWIEKRAPGEEYFYNWDMTQKTITFTLKYNGDLNGTLHGDDAKYWVLSTTGEIFGKVGEAYVGKYVDVVYTDGIEGEEVFEDQTYNVMTGNATPAFHGNPTRKGYTFSGWTPEVAKTVTGPATYTATWTPNAPEQSNVVEGLVTVICDSDPDRHASVTGKWYPQHCSTTSDIVWNEELGTWTVDIRIGSLYIMYVDQLENANNGTIHELVEDITTVYSTLKWDAEQGLWVPTQPIELHTTCRTAPVAPSYDQINGYQIKVYGDVDDDGIYGETKPSNNGIGEVYTTSIPEGGYTLSEVYGSREEGFFVDVTVPIENGDAYITNWIANCEPGAEYLYDFEKTPTTVTFTLRYNGSLTGTLHGDRHASNTNYDWVLDTNGSHFGVVGEGYVEQKTYAVQLVIYRNGNTTAPYDVIALENLPKGAVIDLSALDINDYYSSRLGFEFEGWFNDGAWNQYKAGKEVAGLEEITVNGWTNIICMVTDYQTVQIQIYRNGNTTDVYKTITLDKMLKGDVLDLTTLDINDYYSSTYGFVFEGWFNDGKWNQYKAGQDVTGMTEITINGWTNIICMVTDCQKVVVKAVVNGDKENAEVIFNGAAPKGVNLIEWLNENVEVPEKEGYTVDMWYNWDWYGHKFGENAKVNGWTNVYVTYTANEYTVSYNTNGGPEVADKVVTFGAKYGVMPNSSITGLSSRKNDWYLVDENGNVTDINIRNTTVVSVARDHELFLMRDVLAPSVKIALTVPGGLSDSYKYYDGNARVLTATVSNMNAEVLDYTYQWYKDGVAIEGATESVLTLEGNVSDSGTYKVVVTATLKDGSEIVVKVDTASGEKSLKVQIMRAANTLRLNENYGETPVTSDSYWGSAVATIRGGATREGYTFAGWNTAADGSGETYQVGDEIEFPGDNGNGGVVLELFAQWNAITYTIKYNGGEGAQYVGSELNSGDNWMLIKNGYTYDQPVTLNDGADFVRPGYKLVGWTIGGQAYELGQTVEKNFTKVQSGTVQAYAIWEPITYRIKYAGGEGAEYVGDLPNSKDDWVIIAGYPYGQEITLHDGTGFQRTGYTLTGWIIKGKTYELGGTAEGSFTTVQSGMITAYAVWKANTYTLILDANGGEFVMPLAEESDAVTTLEIPVTFGQAIGELPTPVRKGYTFAGWFDAEGNEITDETVYNTDGDLTVTAAWTPNTYEVKLDANGGKLEDDTIEVTYGEPVGELPTPTREGYTFAGWVDAEGNKVTADTIYDVADDTTLVATWNVNKPADPSSPPTGDGMTMFFMVSMLASAAALLFLADRKRRMA